MGVSIALASRQMIVQSHRIRSKSKLQAKAQNQKSVPRQRQKDQLPSTTSSSRPSLAAHEKPNTAKAHQESGDKVPGRDGYFWDYSLDEHHARRRQQILAKYPQIKERYGYDPKFKYSVAFVVAIQLVMAYYAPNLHGWYFGLAAYAIGGTCNHIPMFAIHECAHNMAFRHMYYNRIFSFFVNLPIAFPSANTFKRYHMDDHKYQGEHGIDVVIATGAEARLFQGKLMKLVYLVFQIFFFAFRPVFVNRRKKWGRWEFINAVCCLAFSAAVYYFWSPWSLCYLLAGTVLGSGVHPSSAHFIAEHCIFVQHAETYSYYGPMNAIHFNVGYHNEHHDFPNIPGSRLPLVHVIAPEFYRSLPHHTSHCRVLYDFVMDDPISLYSRLKRQRLTGAEKSVVQQR